ncbi:hypothetical protein Acsp01_47560 [Actinoplanes sp. NBRC 101535]|nr:hypothetical protein Acsp01_47560 [Actinoplanes sp. NBRC 101535]
MGGLESETGRDGGRHGGRKRQAGDAAEPHPEKGTPGEFVGHGGKTIGGSVPSTSVQMRSPRTHLNVRRVLRADLDCPMWNEPMPRRRGVRLPGTY